MEKEILTEPMIFHGAGGCPHCCGPLAVADSELTLMELNQDGQPISEETRIKCVGVCLHCGNKIRMTRWKGGYVPYSELSEKIRQYQLIDEAKRRVDELNKTKSNPLVIVG